MTHHSVAQNAQRERESTHRLRVGVDIYRERHIVVVGVQVTFLHNFFSVFWFQERENRNALIPSHIVALTFIVLVTTPISPHNTHVQPESFKT